LKTNPTKRSKVEAYWNTAPELPNDVFLAWRKSNARLNPCAILATVDPDGKPRTAPFGSVRTVTPQKIKLVCFRHHKTYRNLATNGLVMVALVAPPNIAVSVRGRARVVKEQMEHDDRYAIIEIDIEEVKNDMVFSITIDEPITITPHVKFQDWFRTLITELEEE
jgi:uncharacterized pyridoxamine 5'-phosphate oxidase family protein